MRQATRLTARIRIPSFMRLPSRARREQVEQTFATLAT